MISPTLASASLGVKTCPFCSLISPYYHQAYAICRTAPTCMVTVAGPAEAEVVLDWRDLVVWATAVTARAASTPSTCRAIIVVLFQPRRRQVGFEFEDGVECRNDATNRNRNRKKTEVAPRPILLIMDTQAHSRVPWQQESCWWSRQGGGGLVGCEMCRPVGKRQGSAAQPAGECNGLGLGVLVTLI
jgi:hypothetical protein